MLAILALLCAGIYLWRLQAAQRRLVLEIDDLCGQLMQNNHRANALAMVYDELRAAFDRRTIAYDRARRAFVEQRAAAQELQGALSAGHERLGCRVSSPDGSSATCGKMLPG